MTTITVTKLEDGKLGGYTEKDRRAYAKFLASIKALEFGELFTLNVWFPRNPKFHRLHFAVIKALLESQEQFADLDALRKWLYVGAGYADFMPGPKGQMVAIPKSIAYDKLDDAEFADLHDKVTQFMRSTYCRRFLWPHLSDERTYETIDRLLMEFER